MFKSSPLAARGFDEVKAGKHGFVFENGASKKEVYCQRDARAEVNGEAVDSGARPSSSSTAPRCRTRRRRASRAAGATPAAGAAGAGTAAGTTTAGAGTVGGAAPRGTAAAAAAWAWATAGGATAGSKRRGAGAEVRTLAGGHIRTVGGVGMGGGGAAVELRVELWCMSVCAPGGLIARCSRTAAAGLSAGRGVAGRRCAIY